MQTIAESINDYMASRKGRATNRLAPATLKQDASNIAPIVGAWGADTLITDIDSDFWEAHLDAVCYRRDGQRLKPESVHARVKFIKGWLSWERSRGGISQVPWPQRQAVTAEGRANTNTVIRADDLPDVDTVQAIVTELRNHERRAGLLFRFMLATGVRPGEALAIQPRDLFGDQTVHIRKAWARGQDGHVIRPTKTGKERDIVVPGVVMKELRAFISDEGIPLDGFVFHARCATGECDLHRPWILDGARKVFNRACEMVGVEGPHARPYVLRHRYATTMLAESRLPIPELAAQLGHSVETLLRTYVHADGTRWRSQTFDVGALV